VGDSVAVANSYLSPMDIDVQFIVGNSHRLSALNMY